MKLACLYKKDNSDNIRIWKIEVKNNKTIITHGLENGKQIINERLYTSKNVGKKNETTPQEQAELEAQRKWDEKITQGYVKKKKN